MNLKRLSAIAVAVLLSLSTALSAFALDSPDDSYVVTLYNDQNGLPTGEANDIIQTSDGYIWIGSYGGLIRYDGSEFRNFSLEGAIASSSVRALTEDALGRLWIGTNDAGVFVMENGEITRIPSDDDTTFLCIRDFAAAPDGTVYAASNSGIAVIKDGFLKPAEGEHAVGGTVYSVDIDSRGRVWGSLNNGLIVVLENDKEINLYGSESFVSGAESVYCTGSDEFGNIYLGTSGSEVIKLEEGWDALAGGSPEDNPHIRRIETPGVTTHNMIRTGPDGSVIVCGNIGACVILRDGRQLYFGEADHAASLNSGCVDYEGNVWLASTSFGILKYTEGCFESPNRAAGLDGIPLNALVKAGDRYFVAADTGILCFDDNWQPVENSLTEFYAGVRSRCLIVGQNGNVWVATYATHDSVACYDPGTDALTTFDVSDGLLSSGARTVYELSDGSVAVGTQEGLNIIRDGKVVASYGSKEGFSTTSVLCTIESREGSILVGSDGGGIYEIKDGQVTPHGFSEGLSDGVVLRILTDTEGDGYFISAGSNLYYWNADGFRKLAIQKGAGSVFDFYVKDHCLWVLQNAGILCYDREKLLSGEDTSTVAEYGVSHGLSGSLNANTWNWIDPETGSLYLVTRSGVSVFDFGGLENILPKVAINGVWVDGEELKGPSAIELERDAGRLTIGFSALSYTDTSDFAIAYCLEGFDKEETVLYGVKSESVSYTNLPGGEYRFVLRVFHPQDPDGQGNEFVLEINKVRKLVEYPLFYVALLLLTVGLVAGIAVIIARARVRSAEKRQKEYRKIVVQSLQTFARAIDAKDKYTNGHSLRVAEYSLELAKRLGLSEREQENVYYIALLHDIGKIGVPDSILNKPGKLTDEERALIQNHPLIGGEILKDFTAIDGIDDGAKYHHERIDGSGYNEHRRGDEIPFIARIIGVADTYDAMSSTRCYRPALTEEVIVAELKRVSGTQLDPKIVPHMLDMIAEGVAPLADDAHIEARDIGAHYKT